MHVGYGLGFLRGSWNYWILAKPAEIPKPETAGAQLTHK